MWTLKNIEVCEHTQCTLYGISTLGNTSDCFHDTYACAEGFVKYVQAWKHHFVHVQSPCACTDNCFMYIHSRKHNFVQD